MPETSVIHDLGYQRYTGSRLGRGYAFRTLYLHSLRTAFGMGRGVKAKLFSWTIAGIIGAVGVILTAVQNLTGKAPMTYPQFVNQMSILTILFLAIVGPELVCRDQHTRMLSLYFARPLRRSDYALARLGALISAVWLVLAAPQAIMFAGAALSTTGGTSEVLHEAGRLATGLSHAATQALVLGSLSLLIASFMRQRAVAAASIVAVFLITTPVVAFTQLLGGSEGTQELASLANPAAAVRYLGKWLYTDQPIHYGPLLAGYVVVVSAASVALLLARYRKVAA